MWPTSSADRGSVLALVKDMVGLRRQSPDLVAGAYRSLPSSDGVWLWRRGTRTVVALNLSDQSVPVALTAPHCQIAIATDRSLDGTTVSGSMDLGTLGRGVLLETT